MNTSSRQLGLDILRAMAVIFMVISNSQAVVMVDQPHFINRLFNSSAAPLFILISGWLAAGRQRDWKTVKEKAWFVVLTGALIDALIWWLVPFYGFDVLYLIGFSLLVVRASDSLSSTSLLVMAFVVAALGFGAARFPGYVHNVKNIPLLNPYSYALRTQLDQALINGYFPALPWLSLPLLAAWAKRQDWTKTPFVLHLLVCLAFLGAGVYALGITQPMGMETYSEFFYPLGPEFMLYVFGLLLLIPLFLRIPLPENSRGLQALAEVGKGTIQIYIWHSLVLRLAQVAGLHLPLWGVFLFCLAIVLSSRPVFRLLEKRIQKPGAYLQFLFKI